MNESKPLWKVHDYNICEYIIHMCFQKKLLVSVARHRVINRGKIQM